MKHLYLFAAMASVCANAWSQELPATNEPNEGLYFMQCYIRQYSDRAINTFINFQMVKDGENNNYVLHGIVDELIEYGSMRQDGKIEKVSDLRGHIGSDGLLTIAPWQHVMRQQDENGVWHDVYFTGGHCGWDFTDEDDLKQSDNNSNLAVKDLPVLLTVRDNNGEYTSMYSENGFFFVWENESTDEKRFHYCDYFQVSGDITQYNAIFNAEGHDSDNHLPIAPHKSFYMDWVGAKIFHGYVVIVDDIMKISSAWQPHSYNNASAPAVTFSRNATDSDVWNSINTLCGISGNPLNAFLWEIDSDRNLIGDEANLTVKTRQDEWGNMVIDVPTYRRMYYTPEGHLSMSFNTEYPQVITIYRFIPEVKLPGNGDNGDNGDNGENAILTQTESDGHDNVEYFNLQGMRLNNPVRGTIVIERKGMNCRKIRF